MAVKNNNYRPIDSMVLPRFAGVRTFMRLPHVTDLEGVDFAVVGVPFDTGSTFRVGARFGPEGIRSASVLLRPYNPGHRIGIFDYCAGVDYGDLPVIPGYLPQSHQRIKEEAIRIFEKGVVPIFLGGDHSVSLPLLRAVHAVHGPVALVHLDSHSDLWAAYYGGLDTHGTPFRRAVEENLLDLSRSIQVGLRGPVYDSSDMVLSREMGFDVVMADELHARGVEDVVRQIRERVGDGPAYLSFDIDFVDPAFAPGTGTPEVGGFTSAQSQQLIRGLAGINFLGFDIVEVMPPYDPAGVTSLLAANIAYEFISLVAVRERDRAS